LTFSSFSVFMSLVVLQNSNGGKMRYYDAVYARQYNDGWELPPILEELSHTVEAVRARELTQAVMPNYLNIYGPIPSRFQHGMGVAFLTWIMLRKNTALADDSDLILASALMHDWGLPCLSHLPEYFLEKSTGMDGESFLKYVLENSCDAIDVLRDFDVDYKDVIKIVTGGSGPLGAVLKGSMDLDNLDNVLRYALAAALPGRKPNVIEIADSFRFNGEEWVLMDRCLQSVKRWQACRQAVYSKVYGQPHLSPAMMIFRAIDLAYREGRIDTDFFLMSDGEAIEYLAGFAGGPSILAQRLICWEWYQEVFSAESSYSASVIGALARDSENRGKIADLICEELGLEPEDICVYAGVGKEKRRITVPFVSANGNEVFLDDSDDAPVYRFKVFASPEIWPEDLKYITNLAGEIASGEMQVV
jgi:HD superfamily phosphohydrolase